MSELSRREFFKRMLGAAALGGVMPFVQSQLVASTIVEDCITAGQHTLSVFTGIAEIDEVVGGLQGGDLIEITALPSCGGSLLALNVGLKVIEQRATALYIATYTGQSGLRRRVELITGSISPEEFRQFSRTGGVFIPKPIAAQHPALQLLCRPEFALESLRIDEVEECLQRYQPRVLLIDDEQESSTMNRAEAMKVKIVLRQLKELAVQRGITVIVATKSSYCGYRTGRQKRLSPKRKHYGLSGNEADVVLQLERPEIVGVQYFKDGMPTKDIISVQVNALRRGVETEARIRYLKNRGRFEPLVPPELQYHGV